MIIFLFIINLTLRDYKRKKGVSLSVAKSQTKFTGSSSLQQIN